MVKGLLARGALYWLRAPRDYNDVRHDEWVLAVTRLLLSLCCLSAIFREARIASPLYNVLSISYLIFSVAIILVLQFRSHTGPLFHVEVQCADLLWAVHLMILINWPPMAFSLFFFLVAGTGFRWGFWEAQLANAFFCTILMISTPVYHLSLPQLWNSESASDLIPEIVVYVVITSMVGLIAEGKSVRSEAYSIAKTVEHLRLDAGFERALLSVSKSALQKFGATQILMAVDDNSRDGISLFRITSSNPDLQSSSLDSSHKPQYFFPAPQGSWRVAVTGLAPEPQLRCESLESGKIKRVAEPRGIGPLLAEYPFRLMMGVSMKLGDEFSARIYVIDPLPFFGGRAGMRYLDMEVRQAVPAIHDMFRVERMRTRAEAAASGRVARELHDGVIQSLCAMNLQLQQMRQETVAIFKKGADPLAQMQKRIQDEIAALREYTQQLRALEIDSSRLLGYLAGLATKFQIEHGIVTHFVTDVQQVNFRPQVCVEVARIAQEALVNVRKHSQASEVILRLGRRNEDWVLNVIDNGRGFGFNGRLEHEELQASGRGPAVIMERARGIKGRVSIESDEGTGSLVEVTFPYEAA